jgi:hypothetical protein
MNGPAAYFLGKGKMPRQQNSQKRSSPAPPPKIYAPPPKIWHASPPVAASQSIFQSVKDGVGLGMGSAIGHRIIGGIFGSTNPPAMPPPAIPSISAPPLQPQQPYYASEQYTQCLEQNQNFPDVCKPFLSKDKSPWKQCMEQNFYKADYCTTESSTSR